MAFSDYGSTTSVRPDKPLIVKCTFDQRMKRITFTSSRNCSYDLLRERVEQCFALSATPFTIRYKDDDGEVTDVTSDGDLTEAIHYFHVGDDPPTSSAASITSGRSMGGGRKVTLRLTVVVDYELSLSDTASLASQEEYDYPNASDLTLAREPLNGYHHEFELEDDAVTVSSRDTTSIPRGAPVLHANSRQNLRSLSPVLSDDSPPTSPQTPQGLTDETHADENIAPNPSYHKKLKDVRGQDGFLPSQDNRDTHPQTADDFVDDSHTSEEPPLDFFDRLKRLEGAELGESYVSQEAKRLSQTERGVQWLRDQNVRAIQSMFGALPEPSVSDDTESLAFEGSPEEDLVGDLALQQDPSGKYYYTYTSSSGASQIQEEVSEFAHDDSSIQGSVAIVEGTGRHEEPSPRGLAWLADQRAHATPTSLVTNPFTDPSPMQLRERYQIHPDIPPEVLKFIPENRLPLLPPEDVTNCSACGLILESFRYVCTTCGEQGPHSRHSPMLNGKGKGKDVPSHTGINPILPHKLPSRTISPSSSSWTLLSSPDSSHKMSHLQTALGKLNFVSRGPAASSSQDTLFVPVSGHIASPEAPGYELCSSCIESAGVIHALEAGASKSHNSSPLSSSQENIRDLIHLRRTIPRPKGHIRHSYREKVWGREGWKDVEQDDISKCSICNASLKTNRYKCASCAKFDLCRACYSQVHEIHPSHAFLSVPDQPSCLRCELESNVQRQSLDMNGVPSLKHPGVKCHHCMLDIVGARFHCAVCDSVDICSNCESAGLPGNLTSPDGGHDSSHIMIKIPYPLESTEVETASKRAISLWHGRDRPDIQRPRGLRRSSSQDSGHDRTVVGSRAARRPHSEHANGNDEHHLPCRACGISITGIRYQCATCPSTPTSYNLCTKCEVMSFLVHDGAHIFIKIPRPLDRQIQTPFPLVPPTLYSTPAGFVDGRRLPPHADPRTYIQSLYHRTAVCDRCIEHIRGVWLHCAYCGSDLCEDCEAIGGHDKTHVFLMFKSMVNMQRLGEICNIENPPQSPPIIPHPVYLSS
ncbi:hypothetical protein K439DRAFT_1385302 [Ramaria rubella]|nr:hypothetical protein K439DRAFT_1385302 [Ramaria rubella]